MKIFLTLLIRLIPLYLVIGLGYIAGRKLGARKETLAALLIYIISPLVIFNGAVTVKLTAGALSLPVLFFVLACVMCLLFYQIGRRVFPDTTKNILAFTAGTGNTGYFGLPVAVAIFSPDVLGLVVLSILGFIVYENTLGFYITARGNYSVRDALRKLLTLPTIYAFILGVIINLAHIPLGQTYIDIAQSFRGAYTVLGMMIIGVGIGDMAQFVWDWKFNLIAFVAKFLVWPLLGALVIVADQRLFHFYDHDIYRIIILMSIVPLAANTVAYATQLKAHPEKAAVAVLGSTLFALIYIPIIVSLFLGA